MRYVLCLAIIGLMAVPASAVVLDGSISGDGYAKRSVQQTQTNFGDNQSELNAGWAQVDSGVLWLTLTGNIQNNFNKLNIFIDSVPGGENQLTPDTGSGGNNPTNDGWANKHATDQGDVNADPNARFMFDAGFAADYMIISRRGNAGGDRFDFDFSSVGNASVVEASLDIFSGSDTGTNASVGASGIGVSYDNSNVAGVGGGTGAADQSAAMAVQTGLELAIPLSAIGNPNLADIKISAMVNGSNHDFLSNQFLGALEPPQDNLGGDGSGNFTSDIAQINLKNFSGDQFFFAVPEPGTIALAGLALVGMLSARRRD